MLNSNFALEENELLKQLDIKKSFVRQLFNWDCGVACLSMILNESYKIVFGHFTPKACNKISQRGLSYKSVVEFIKSYKKNVKLLTRAEKNIKDIEKVCEVNKEYLIILKRSNETTHFCYIYDKILFDPELGVVILEDELDLESYIKCSKFVSYKYLTEILD